MHIEDVAIRWVVWPNRQGKVRPADHVTHLLDQNAENSSFHWRQNNPMGSMVKCAGLIDDDF